MTTATIAPSTQVDVVNLGKTHYSMGNGWMIKPGQRLANRLFAELPERVIVDAQIRPGRPTRLAIVPAGTEVSKTIVERNKRIEMGLPVDGVGATAQPPKPATKAEEPKADEDDTFDLGETKEEIGEDETIDLTETPLRRGAQSAPKHKKGIRPLDNKTADDPLNPPVGTLPTGEADSSPGMEGWAKRAEEKKPTRRRTRTSRGGAAK